MKTAPKTPLPPNLRKLSLKANKKPYTKPRRVKMPTLRQAKVKLWELCKQITRKKHGSTCFTSGKQGLEGSNWQTGHYIASSLCSTELRYDLKNLRPQSYQENINHSGNTLQFRRNLIRDHGIEYVEELETRNQKTKGQKFDILWYVAKIEEYSIILAMYDKTRI